MFTRVSLITEVEKSGLFNKHIIDEIYSYNNLFSIYLKLIRNKETSKHINFINSSLLLCFSSTSNNVKTIVDFLE